MRDFIKEIKVAKDRIGAYIHNTPLEEDFNLSAETGGSVFRKLENWQVSGSFKIRGVMNKILSIKAEERNNQHYVAASTGNHAAAFAYTMQLFGLSGDIFVPVHVNPLKKRLIESMGIRCKLVGKTSLQTEIFARQYAEQNGYILVHPYNDWDVVFGQGTIGLEILEKQPDVDTIVVPVGGGGMISGISAYAKSIRPEIEIIGVQPVNSPEMFESLKTGHIIEEDISKPTWSDGTAGGIEQGAITFDLCRKFVDKIVLISEQEIEMALKAMIQNDQIIIEGAAAMSIALLRKFPNKFKDKNVAVVLCGRRLSPDKLKLIV